MITMPRRILTLILLAAAIALPALAQRTTIYPEQFKPGSPFSPGVLVGDTLYCAGQTGSDPQTGQYPTDFSAEVEQTFKRIGYILKAAGHDFADVVDAKVYLTDISNFQAMNTVFQNTFPKDPPARTTVEVSSLVGKARIEITVVARK